MAWLFSRSTSKENVDLKGDEEDEDLKLDLDNEEKEFHPPCSLQVCAGLSTGEEDEVEIYVQRAKMFRFAGKWKERGIGDARLLKHAGTGKVRFVMRQEKTFKLIANHSVTNQPPYCDLLPLSESKLFWVWRAQNSIDNEVVDEMIALKFDMATLAETFSLLFNSSKSEMCASGVTETCKAPSSTAEEDLVEEEEVMTVDGWTPSMTLEVQQMQTGEEQEELLYQQRSKLFRFRDSEWKERGVGSACLLRNSETSAVRFLMREEKTRKVLANHAVANIPPYCDIIPGFGSDRTFLWLAQNYAEDGEVVDEKLGLKLGSQAIAQQFEMAWKSVLEQSARGSEEKASASSPKRVLAIADESSAPMPSRKSSRHALEDRKASHLPLEDEPPEVEDVWSVSPESSTGHAIARDLIPMRTRTVSELDRSEQFFSALAHSTEPFPRREQQSEQPAKSSNIVASASEEFQADVTSEQSWQRPLQRLIQQIEKSDHFNGKVQATPCGEQQLTKKTEVQGASLDEDQAAPFCERLEMKKIEVQEPSMDKDRGTSFGERLAQEKSELQLAYVEKPQAASFSKRLELKSPERKQFDKDGHPDSVLEGRTSVKDMVARLEKGQTSVKTAVSQLQNAHRDWRQRAALNGRSVRSTHEQAAAKRPREDDIDTGTSLKRLRTTAQAVATIPTPQQQELSHANVMDRLGKVAGRLERFSGLGLGLHASALTAEIGKAGYADFKKLLQVAERIESAASRLVE